MRSILLVEDDRHIGDALAVFLRAEGFAVTLCATLKAARQASRYGHFDVVLLDINLPDGLGFELCNELVENDPQLPILFLTAKLDEESAVKALSLGAIDYIRKPFSQKELLLRVRRAVRDVPKVLVAGKLRLDGKTGHVTWDGTRLHLTPRELDILRLLLQHKGGVVTREKILDQIDEDGSLDDKTINTYVKRLKEKLTEAGVTGLKIVAVYGAGYRAEEA